MSGTTAVECILPVANRLGECPLWCDRAQRLYWVDSRGPALHWLDPDSGRHGNHDLPELVGSIALRDGGGLLAALASGVFALSEEGELGPRLATPEPDLPDNRLNDGRCDRQGRFWVGSMNDKRRDPTGNLWSIGADLAPVLRKTDVIVPNSIGWSPDDRTMYFADTYRHHILAFDFDLDEGRIDNPRLFADCASHPGRPDGSAVDSEGFLWNAEYAGSRLVRYAPDGRIDRVVPMPVSQPSCCCFGGPDLDCLFVTSATQRLSEAELASQPLAGGLFMLRPGVTGLPEARFAG